MLLELLELCHPLSGKGKIGAPDIAPGLVCLGHSMPDKMDFITYHERHLFFLSIFIAILGIFSTK